MVSVEITCQSLYLYPSESYQFNHCTMKSKFLAVDWKDFSRGLLIAFLTAVITGIINMLDTGSEFTWLTLRPVLIAGISAALSYLLKCLATNSQDQLFKREPVFS